EPVIGRNGWTADGHRKTLQNCDTAIRFDSKDLYGIVPGSAAQSRTLVADVDVFAQMIHAEVLCTRNSRDLMDSTGLGVDPFDSVRAQSEIEPLAIGRHSQFSDWAACWDNPGY